MTKITFIGAGSTIFAKNLMGDILSFPELADSTLTLHDIDQARLRTSEIVAHKIAETLNVQPTIEAITVGARTDGGHIGDGKIFILELGQCLRIRTGETGSVAIG